MIRYSIWLLFLSILTTPSFAQENLDSLKTELHREQNDSLKMQQANELGYWYYRMGQGDSSIRYLDMAIGYAKKLGHDEFVYDFTLSKAETYGRIGNKEMAFAMTDTASALAIRFNNAIGQAKALVFKGDMHSRFGNSSESIYAYNNALTLATANNLSSWMATALNNLSLEYQLLGDEETSIEYLIQSVKIREKDNSKYLGTSYANLANAYKRQKRFDQAIESYEKALSLLENDQFTDNRIVCLRNLGDTYTQLEKYGKAKKLLRESYNLVLTKENDPVGRAMYFFLTSTVYQKQQLFDSVIINGHKVMQLLGDRMMPSVRSSNLINMANARLSLATIEKAKRQYHLDRAVEFGEKALTLAKELNSYSQINRVAKSLMKIYGQTANSTKTLEQAELYGNSLDSLNKIEQSKKVVALQTKYQVEKKELQINVLQKESQLAQAKIDEAAKENRNQVYFMVLIGFVLLVFMVFAALLYRQVKLKNKANSNLSVKNKTISKQNEEKELLLKEIHHRVKNNLQVVSSLLDLQSKKAGDGEKAALAEGQSRVRAMALIHEKLYESKTISEIDFEAYCKQLSHQIAQLYDYGQQVECEIDVDNIKLDIDTAVPVGLILNELVTNAYKYAFTNGVGRLRISAKKNEQNTYTLRIEDTGEGLPDDFDWRKSKSLGLRLVNRLARQLYGKAEYSKDEKSTFEVTFKDSIERKKVA